LADRLGDIAHIISVNQNQFVKDQQINRGNVAVKIDIKKTFDIINWGFLLKVLYQFGFRPIFCEWIAYVLHSAILSIRVNGKKVGLC